MALSLGILSVLIISALANYNINLNDPSASVTYNYEVPEDFTNALVKVKLNLDYSYYNNLFSTGDGLPIDILTVRSPSSGQNDLFDYMAFQLMSGGMPDGPPLLMVIISSPLSSKDFSATTFCIGMVPYDFADKLITVTKTGTTFTLHFEGLEDSADNVFCQDYSIGKAGSGRMDLSTVIIGPNLKGCVSLLEFPGVDLLPADDCGFPVSLFSGDITYFEGTCSDIPDTSVVCPTTKPPPPTTPEPTTRKQTTKPEPTTRKQTTKPEPTTRKETTKPEPTTEAKTTKALPEITEPEVTTPEQETSEHTSTLESTTISDPPAPGWETEPETEEKPATDGPATDGNDTDDGTVIVVGPDNETEGGYDSNELEDSDTEAATGDENSNSVVIIIGVVSAGIVVIVILLYVGYRFHFRDKGSYKLEETKGEPNGEDFGNEYTDLNPTPKDQEWYL